MKKLVSFVLILSVLPGLCSCGTGNKDTILFENDTNNGIEGLYLSYPDSGTWGDQINESKIRSGDSLDITDSVTGDDKLYDVGAINSQGINYDFTRVAIKRGDKPQLTLEDDEGILTIVTAGGSTRDYKCDIYKNADKAQKNDVFLTNKTGVRLDGIYLSSKDASKWGSKLNDGRIGKGDVFVMPATALTSGEDIYDVGAVDENGRNYDLLDVQLGPGYSAVIYLSKDEAVLEVTSKGGTTQVYRGTTYLNKKQ